MIEAPVLTLTAGEALAELLLVRIEASTNDAIKCGNKERAYGVTRRPALDTEPVAVSPLKSATVERLTASEPIVVGDTIYPAASGKVQNTPVDTGHYRIGIALQAASADGKTFECLIDPSEIATS